MNRYLTEFTGTFFLVFTIGCSVLVGTPMAPLAIGASLMVMVYMGGHVSGAHYNPAVSLGLVLRGSFAMSELGAYVTAQLLGAIAASLAVWAVTGRTFAASAPRHTCEPSNETLVHVNEHRHDSKIRAVVSGTGRHLPDQVWTSEMVEARVNRESGGWTIPKDIVRMAAGVVERRYAPEGTSSSELAARAARRALDESGLEPQAIDLLIFASASHDVAEPATANMLQAAVGCDNAAVMDVKNACNSFLNGLEVAHAFIETGRAGRVLVAAGERLSPTIKWNIADNIDLAAMPARRSSWRPAPNGTAVSSQVPSSPTAGTGSSRPCWAVARCTEVRRIGCSSSAAAPSCSSSQSSACPGSSSRCC